MIEMFEINKLWWSSKWKKNERGIMNFHKLKSIFQDQSGAYTIMTALMLPVILLFMGLAMGMLSLLNSKSRLSDASEAAAFAMAKENHKNDDDKNHAITESVYQFYFPHLSNIGVDEDDNTHTFKTTHVEKNHTTPPNSAMTQYPDKNYSCTLTEGYYQGSVHHYRASATDFKIASFAGSLFGNIGFKAIETVVGTALAKTGGSYISASESCVCNVGFIGVPPNCIQRPHPALSSISVSFVLDSSSSVRKSFPYEIDMIKTLANRLRNTIDRNARINFHVLSFNTRFKDSEGTAYRTLIKNIQKVIDKEHYLEDGIFTSMGILSWLSPMPKASKVRNILDDGEYQQFLSSLDNITFHGGDTGMSAPYLYSIQKLYYTKDSNHKTVNNLSIIMTDGYPTIRRPEDHDYQINTLDKAWFCNTISDQFRQDGREFTSMLFLIPGQNGANDFPNKDFMKNCFSSDRRFYNETLNPEDIESFVKSMYQSIQKVLQSESGSGLTGDGNNNKPIITGGVRTTNSAPRLIYRWDTSEIALPN